MNQLSTLNHNQHADSFLDIYKTGNWQKTINYLIENYGISEKEISIVTGVSISTVKRWRDAGTRPLSSAMDYIVEDIVKLLKEKTKIPG